MGMDMAICRWPSTVVPATAVSGRRILKGHLFLRIDGARDTERRESFECRLDTFFVLPFPFLISTPKHLLNVLALRPLLLRLMDDATDDGLDGDVGVRTDI